ncbi:hypothetical protein [Sporosarcina limicola]|uniref:Uncharacterized protein n=1 Tax=Sporosarcina limicola TaxID=34101 RepID=A0A927R4M7_9BACL|nr:hypothetical protein [Sporosarcina limicola]MBE1553049.1 hypothetical protein [Sporosarcina limicola]
MGRTIYIVLTDTGTLLSRAIGLYTREDLNHASIAFDEQLTEMYSFGRKQRHNPFVGGFVKEEAAEGIFRDADCAIFSCEVSDEEYDKMRMKIRQIEQNKEQYRYNFIGLFGIAFKVKIQRKRAFFCSQFVATIVNESGVPMFAIKPYLVQPHHFADVPCLIQIYEGDLQVYLQKVRGQQERKPIHINMWKSLVFRLLA